MPPADQRRAGARAGPGRVALGPMAMSGDVPLRPGMRQTRQRQQVWEAIQRLVEDSFERFLHRPSDPAGLAGWVAWLQRGVNALQPIVVSDLVSGVRDETFLAKVIGSEEYFERV